MPALTMKALRARFDHDVAHAEATPGEEDSPARCPAGPLPAPMMAGMASAPAH